MRKLPKIKRLTRNKSFLFLVRESKKAPFLIITLQRAYTLPKGVKSEQKVPSMTTQKIPETSIRNSGATIWASDTCFGNSFMI